jgi:hypothetical protein
MAKISPSYSAQIDQEMFLRARQMDLDKFNQLVPELHQRGVWMVGDHVTWLQFREWENGKLVARQWNTVYYELLPGVGEKEIVAGYYTLGEQEMFLKGEGPIVRGTPEQVALEAIFNPSHRERRY